MEYTSEATKNLSAVITAGTQNAAKFSFSLKDNGGSDCEINDPPVLEIVRILSSDDLFNIDSMSQLAKYCLMNRATTIKYGDQIIGSLIINDMNIPWDSYDVLKRYPLALQFIINTCAAEVIKKSIPSQVGNISV